MKNKQIHEKCMCAIPTCKRAFKENNVLSFAKALARSRHDSYKKMQWEYKKPETAIRG